MSTGQGFGYSLFGNSIKSNDVTAINNYANALKNGASVGEAWRTTMTGTSVAAKQYVLDARKAGKSTTELTQGLNNMTLGAKASTVAMKALGVAKNIALNVGVMLLITGITKAIDALVHAQERAAEKAQEAARETSEQSEKSTEAVESLIKLKTQLAEGSKSSDELTSAFKEQLKAMGWTETEIDTLIAKYGGLAGAIDEATRKALENARTDAHTDVSTSGKSLETTYDPYGWTSDTKSTVWLGEYDSVGNELRDKIIEIMNPVSMDMDSMMSSITFGAKSDSAEDIYAYYQGLQQVVQLIQDTASKTNNKELLNSDVYKEASETLKELGESAKLYGDAINRLHSTDAKIELADYLKTNNINNKESFNSYIEGIQNSTEYSDAYKQVLIDVANEAFPQFSNAAKDAGENLDKMTASLKGISDQKDALNELFDAYEKDMKLTADDVADILEEHPEYIQYLTKVGDSYKVNQKALDDWNKANEEQQRLIDEQMGSNSYAEKYNPLLDSMSSHSWKPNSGGDGDWEGGSKALDDIIAKNKELNQSFADGKISATNYFNSLSDSITNSGLEDALDDINGKFDETTDKIEATVAVLAGELSDAMIQANKRYNLGKTSVGDYIDELDAGLDAQTKLLKSTYDLEVGEDGLVKVTKDMDEATKQAAKSFNNAFEIQDDIDAVNEFADAMESYSDRIMQYVGEDNVTLTDAILGDVQLFNTHMDNVTDSLVAFAGTSAENFNTVSQQIQSALSINQQAAEDLIKQGGDAIQAAAGQNMAAINGLSQSAMTNCGTTITNASQAIGGVLSALGEAIDGFEYSIKATPYIKGDFDFKVVDGKPQLSLGSFGFDITGSGGSSIKGLSQALSDAGNYFTNQGNNNASGYSNYGSSPSTTAADKRPTSTNTGSSKDTSAEDAKRAAEEAERKALEAFKENLAKREEILEVYKQKIDMIDWGLELVDENDFVTKSDLLNNKISQLTLYGADLRQEFDAIAQTIPNSAEEAEALKSTLSSLGDQMRSNITEIRETQIEFEKLKIDAIVGAGTDKMKSLENSLGNLERRMDLLSKDNGDDYKYVREMLTMDSLLPSSSDYAATVVSKRKENRALLKEQENYHNSVVDLLTEEIAKNEALRETERQAILAKLGEIRNDTQLKMNEVHNDYTQFLANNENDTAQSSQNIANIIDSTDVEFPEPSIDFSKAEQQFNDFGIVVDKLDGKASRLATSLAKIAEISGADVPNPMPGANNNRGGMPFEDAQDAKNGSDGTSEALGRGFDEKLKEFEEKVEEWIDSHSGDGYPFAQKYPITSPYGYRIHPISKTRKFHSGVDFGAPYGTNILSVSSGTVSSSGVMGGYGNGIIIKGADGVSWLYAHMAEPSPFKAGDKITRGQVIGIVGSTGLSTGAHLHLERRDSSGGTSNPLPYLPYYATGTPGGNAVSKRFGIAGENFKPEILVDKATGKTTYIDKPTVFDLSTTDVIGEKATANMPKFATGTSNDTKGNSTTTPVDSEVVEDNTEAIQENTEEIKKYFKVNTNTSPLNVRESGSTSAAILTSIAKGTEVIGHELVNGWRKITYGDNQTGWVFESYLLALESNTEALKENTESTDETQSTEPAPAPEDTIENKIQGIVDKAAQDSLDKSRQIEREAYEIEKAIDANKELTDDEKEDQKAKAYLKLYEEGFHEGSQLLLNAANLLEEAYYNIPEEELTPEIMDAYAAARQELIDLEFDYADKMSGFRDSYNDYVDQKISEMQEVVDEHDFYDNWEEFGTTKVKYLEDYLEYFRNTFPEQGEMIKELERELYTAQQEAIQDVLSETDIYVTQITDSLREKSEALDPFIEKEQALLNLVQKEYEITNSLNEAQKEIDKELAMAKAMDEWLDEDARIGIFNEDDYDKLSEVIDDIRDESMGIVNDYYDTIDSLTGDELYKIEEITAEYERQLAMKQRELEIAKAEVNLQKKQDKLDNVLNEKTERVFKDGGWEYTYNFQNAQQAMQELAEAQSEVANLELQRKQQYDIDNRQAHIDSLNGQKAAYDNQIRLIEEAGENFKKAVEEIQDPIKSVGVSAQKLIDTGITPVIDGFQTFLEKLNELNGDSPSRNFASSSINRNQVKRTLEDINRLPSSASLANLSPSDLNDLVDSANKSDNTTKYGHDWDVGVDEFIADRTGRESTAKSLRDWDFDVKEFLDKKGYAGGTRSAIPGWRLTDEDGLGSEFIITKNGVLQQFKGGEMVFNNEQAKRLFEWSKNNYIPFNLPTLPSFAPMAANGNDNSTHVNVGEVHLHEVQNGHQVVSELLNFAKQKQYTN